MAAASVPHRQAPPHLMQSGSPAAPGPSAPAGGADDDDDDNGEEDNIFRDMSFEEVLEDLNARFLANLPEEEMTLVRLYWQAEQAHWFYEDYLRPLNPLLPSLSQRQFTHLIIASSPLYDGAEVDYDAVWEEYCAYKKMVPCCGGILINSTHDKVLMVRGWKTNAGWCFPRGKINSEESEVACAIREVEEETGFDLSGRINPSDFIKTQINAQEVTMFIVNDVDESTVFETQTRKEIGAIEWVPFFDLPTWSNKKGPKRTPGLRQKKFYNVTPFVGPLKKWLTKRGINPHPKRRVEAVPATRQRELQPFNFDDGSPASLPKVGNVSHVGHQHPTTALDHLFAKFVHKDDNVVALESENARTLDQLFGGLATAHQSSSQATAATTQASEDDALTRLLSGLTTTPGPEPVPQPTLPPPDSKQSKLLAVLSAPKQPATSAPVAAPAAGRSNHQTNLLSMLSPPKAPTAALAPSAPALVPSVLSSSGPSTGSAPSAPSVTVVDDGERHNRQQALLQSLFMGPSAPATPPGPIILRPQDGAFPASGIISPMPPMPPSQTAWPPPSPSGLSGFRHDSPTRAPPQTPPQLGRRDPSHFFTPPPGPMPSHMSPQQPPRAPPFTIPQSQPQGQMGYPQLSPRPPVNSHQRDLLGTLYNVNNVNTTRPPSMQIPMPPYNTPGAAQSGVPPTPMQLLARPPNGQVQNPNASNPYPNPLYPAYAGLTTNDQRSPQSQFFNVPPPFGMGPGLGGHVAHGGPPGYLPPPGRPMHGVPPPPPGMSSPPGLPGGRPPQQQQQQQQPQARPNQVYQHQHQDTQSYQHQDQGQPLQHQPQQQHQAPAAVPSPAMPDHPAPQPQPLAPGAAVHQPVPRPPVGGGLLGLINGTSG